ncbi:hypothetical protein K3M67_13170 [Sphingobium sp. V4]|uniref:hypothetical protein n=1 Tax=Sphingobium sp. V4 TaxID=3038927 RepID=UPI00255823C7|nr:hypothetical protein [Sphingobium sp. V4]WIW87902.1 hypothetical protein K3M67_13170 [Sphingobium sp. V4]
MPTLPFLLSVWALLLTPGPTNMLMALSGAQGGWRRTARLVPVEMAAYLAVVLPVAMLGTEVMADWPRLAQTVKLAAAAWALHLALALWRTPMEGAVAPAVDARRLFVTTLLNPKGLIVALALLPPPRAPAFLPHVALFAASIFLCALFWTALGGQCGGRGDGHRAPWLRRAAASWLALLSGGLALGALAH